MLQAVNGRSKSVQQLEMHSVPENALETLGITAAMRLMQLGRSI